MGALTLALLAISTASARGATLVVDGAGDGHGVGMSQEGALGYAQHGWTYQAILAHYYAGTSLGQAPAKAVVRVLVHGRVRRVGLEQYVRGVVAAEMPADWPMAALEAQAVASRTYALTAHASAKFDVYADTRSQMYLGRAAETERTNAAVAATAGQVVTYGGKPAITYFFASSGGRTESVQNAFPGTQAQPWLVGVEDPYDAGPWHRWRVTMSWHEAGMRLKGLTKGALEGIEVVRRGSSPRIVQAYVVGSGGRTAVSGAQLAQRLGLYDTWAYFSVSGAKGAPAQPDNSGGAVSQAAAPAHVTGEGGVSAPSEAASPGQATGSGGTIAPE